MKIKAVTYVGSFARDQALPPPEGPEFVFIGRSNVGKSSLINTLVGRRDIARTSNTPGKTRTANFYYVNERFYFVDMPGYGYAQVSKAERSIWRTLIENYLAKRDDLWGIIHILDIRHTPSRDDREAAATARESGKPVCFAFNKIDKVKKHSVDQRIAEHLKVLTADPDTAVVPFSSETGAGKRELWAWLSDRLARRPRGSEKRG